ncbi:MAG: zinc ribbon domain-containing protein [Cellulomonadaceae bacterium]
MTTAPAQDQQRLLVVQGLDTRLDQIAHQRANHPTVARLAELDAQLADLHTSLVTSRTAVSDLRREVAKAEADVQQVRDRSRRDQERLDSGAVSAKDAQALTSEMESLGRRQNDLEEIEIEAMERLEAHESTLASVQSAYDALVSAKDAVAAEQRQATAELDEQERTVRVERATAADGIDQGLMAIYERLRARLGGVAVAALRHGRSEASGMPISPAELSRIKALGPDEVVFCEDSGRILVRGEDAF